MSMQNLQYNKHEYEYAESIEYNNHEYEYAESTV